MSRWVAAACALLAASIAAPALATGRTEDAPAPPAGGESPAVQGGEAARPPASTAGDTPWWSAHLQATFVLQRKAGFEAPYTGPNSLVPSPETGYTLTSTLFLGARAWRGAEVFFNAETIQSEELSRLTGLGGLTNGENQKSGGPLPTLYIARAFLRQTVDLGGEHSIEEGGPNQFAGPVATRRLVLTAGFMALTDIFYVGAFAHDPRTQFLNWSHLAYGASDYAANARGYTWGLAVEYYHDDWAFRLGRFAQPKESNGLSIDPNVFEHFGDTLEVERGHVLWGLPGKVSVAGFHNRARMGSFRDALQYAATSGGTPSVGNVRRVQSKLGFGLTFEQKVHPEVGVFARYSFNDGQTETYAFTEIERSLTMGVSVDGRLWRRGGDTFGFAWAMNGISDAHRDYLAAGGLGFFIGDGRLAYRAEQILEAYYSFNAFRDLWITVDGQHIANPAYNADRGPVNVIGLRVHVEY